MPHTSPDPRVQSIVDFFETLQPASVQRMGEFYENDAYFKDPFNEVRGLEDVKRIFSHMYVALHEPHFVVTTTVTQGDQCFIVWDFKFRFKRFDTVTVQTVRGCSHLQLTSDGKIAFHRDYWDAAEELYEKLPYVGALMRWLKKRANS
ncbi:nuclear transport factor 2 family protein [Variovorax sp. PCZ-1]|uniref:nuclear transport factor 2 family protein n=1 Tax=Variovorax sp. PCZ-1 TaxID=2835533 RepID=UPI001BCFBF3C|nr:nuclear transport factor 2 family protein [Variovorax sp. PCZ-1]MBS7808643.1 nuclear transport factor 2 family protein [Variovorax sp. PCZ-1]